jgi:hypothetical protein
MQYPLSMDLLRRLEIPMGGPGEGLVVAPEFHNGWARYFYDQTGHGPTVRLRLGPDPDSTADKPAMTVREVWVDMNNARVGARMMRDLPLGRIEAAINQPLVYEALRPYVLTANAESFPFPDDLREADSEPTDPPWWIVPPQSKRRAPRLKLRIPEGPGKKPDEFYRQVADRFTYLGTVSTRPANELAAANDVNVTTIHGWVKEARRRGLMPAADRRKRES